MAVASSPKCALLLIAFGVLASSCIKDKPVPQVTQNVQLSAAKKVYIVNEGNYGSGNASVSLYDPATSQVVEDIYASANNALIGDVAQSLSFMNGKYYIVVNNSGKVLVCDAQFRKLAQVSGLASPRYMLQVSNQKAYVSDLHSNSIHVLDLGSNVKIASIPCSGWTERMAMVFNKVFVTNLRRDYVYVINTLSDTKSDSIAVGPNASDVVIDKNDKVWVLSGGDSTRAQPPRLSRISAVTNQVEWFADFRSGSKPGYLCLSTGKDSLYFLDRSVFRMSVLDKSIPTAPFIVSPGRNYYGIGVNPNNYCIYLADALDYSQRSTVYIYNSRGSELSFFKAGINANGFYFE